ncbi:MAG: hypothetical protein M0007_15570, partial [Actinomycetota bacterium]|nr:hypothetical protein [Actinomycetota bacterium]
MPDVPYSVESEPSRSPVLADPSLPSDGSDDSDHVGAVTGGAVTGGAVTGGAVTGGAVTGGAVTGGAVDCVAAFSAA